MDLVVFLTPLTATISANAEENKKSIQEENLTKNSFSKTNEVFNGINQSIVTQGFESQEPLMVFSNQTDGTCLLHNKLLA